MSTFSKITLALMAAALVSSPAIAAEGAAPAAAQKPGIADALKSKASDIVSEAQQGVDEKAAKLKEALGTRKKATGPRTMEKVDIIGEAQQGTDTKGAQIKDTVQDKLGTRTRKATSPRTMEKSDVIGEAQQGTDTKGARIRDSLGARDKKAVKPCQQGSPAAGKEEIVRVEQETVTVETPDGIAQETVTTITPETPAKPGDALTKAAKDAVEAGKGAAKDSLKNAVKGAAGK